MVIVGTERAQMTGYAEMASAALMLLGDAIATDATGGCTEQHAAPSCMRVMGYKFHSVPRRRGLKASCALPLAQGAAAA